MTDTPPSICHVIGLGYVSLLVLSLFWFGQRVCTVRQASTIAWANAGPVSMSLYGINVLSDLLSTTSSLCSSWSCHVFFQLVVIVCFVLFSVFSPSVCLSLATLLQTIVTFFTIHVKLLIYSS